MCAEILKIKQININKGWIHKAASTNEHLTIEVYLSERAEGLEAVEVHDGGGCVVADFKILRLFL